MLKIVKNIVIDRWNEHLKNKTTSNNNVSSKFSMCSRFEVKSKYNETNI